MQASDSRRTRGLPSTTDSSPARAEARDMQDLRVR
jgi:hypothetical protein